MTDTRNGQRLLVSGGGNGRPYIRVAVSQLDEVKKLLDRDEIPYWEDSMAVSLDGRPAVIVINLGLEVDAARVQAILDGVE